MARIKTECFCVAYRKMTEKDQCLLFDNGLLSELVFVKNPLGKWFADPFLFEHDEKTYLFAEKFDNFTGRGRIFACCLDDKNPRWKKCKISKCHLSFPNVYKSNDEYYMIPETGDDRELSIYVCDSFPFKWSKKKIIAKGERYVDSVLLNETDGILLTYLISNEEKTNCLLALDNNGNTIFSFQDINNTLRPAGKIFLKNNKSLFVTQNCSEGYGNGLIVNEISFEANLSIKKVKEIDKNIIQNNTRINKKVFGVHTYNRSNKYEVIDIKYNSFSLGRIIGKPFRALFKTRH